MDTAEAKQTFHATPEDRKSRRVMGWFALLLVTLSLGTVLHTWTLYDQTTDENEHIAAGMEMLVNHSYTMDPLNTPLPRIAIAVGPYLLGWRAPVSRETSIIGSPILVRGNYRHNLYAARAGTLLFFMFALYLVWTRAKALLGPRAACVALVLFGFLPPVVTHASLATTDAAAMAMFFWALDRLWRFLELSTVRNGAMAGLACGLGIASKLTIMPLLVLSLAILLLLRWWRGRSLQVFRFQPRAVLVGAGICVLSVWAVYLFNIGTVLPSAKARDKATAILTRHHIPVAPVLAVADHLPAPTLAQGFLHVSGVSGRSNGQWVMGRFREQGVRWFLPVIFLAKMPIPFLLLLMAGFSLGVLWLWKAQGSPYLEVLLIGTAVPFLFGMLSHINLGVRHVLAVAPFAAILAAMAAQWLWRRGTAQRACVAVALAWFAVDAAWAFTDPLPWFNEAAQAMPQGGAWFDVDSDLDWGHDLKRLPAVLAQRNVQHFSFAEKNYTDVSHLNLPPYADLQPGEQATGWVVASVFSLHTPPERFRWLSSHPPVDHIGKSLELFWVPPPPAGSAVSP